jgi:hypothetical protein
VEAGVDHEEGVAEVERVGDRVLVQQDLLLVFAQLLADAIQVYYAVIYALLVGVVLAYPQALRYCLQALFQTLHLQVYEGTRQNAVVYLVAHETHLRLLLEEVAQTFVEIAMHGLDGRDGLAGCCSHQPFQVAALVCVVVLPEFPHPPRGFLPSGRVVLQVELNFLYGLGEHELVLQRGDRSVVFEGVELFVDLDYFLEVQFFEVNVHAAHQEVDEVALLQFVVAQTAQGFQHFGQLTVEVVEVADAGDALAVLVDEGQVVGQRNHLCFEVLVGGTDCGRFGDGQDLAGDEVDDRTAGVFLLPLDRALVQAEEQRDHGRREKVGVDHLNLN